jgi:hypothetical protein
VVLPVANWSTPARSGPSLSGSPHCGGARLSFGMDLVECSASFVSVLIATRAGSLGRERPSALNVMIVVLHGFSFVVGLGGGPASSELVNACAFRTFVVVRLCFSRNGVSVVVVTQRRTARDGDDLDLVATHGIEDQLCVGFQPARGHDSIVVD